MNSTHILINSWKLKINLGARFKVQGEKSHLIIKLLQQQRHTGDCRYPDTMDVMFTSLPWHLDSGNPCRNDEPFTLAEASC